MDPFRPRMWHFVVISWSIKARNGAILVTSAQEQMLTFAGCYIKCQRNSNFGTVFDRLSVRKELDKKVLQNAPLERSEGLAPALESLTERCFRKHLLGGTNLYVILTAEAGKALHRRACFCARGSRRQTAYAACGHSRGISRKSHSRANRSRFDEVEFGYLRDDAAFVAHR